MAKAITRDPIYRQRRFPPELIELCVRWYITHRLSYRDLVDMVAERGITVSHTTIMRWVLHYLPEFERRWTRFARTVRSSWRTDETAVSVRGGRHYLYRAVDRQGKSVASLLCGHRGLRLLAKEDPRWRTVEVRARRYLNNIVEQDHRAIKRRCVSMLGLKSYRTAVITLAGVELANRIRKRQFSLIYSRPGKVSSLKELWDQALALRPERREGELPPLMHQISAGRRPIRLRLPGVGVRYPRKISYGRSLYLLFMPNGGQCWRYCYRHNGKQKTLALGTHPDVSLESARARHQAARALLAAGVDPAIKLSALRSVSATYGLTA